MFPSNRLRVIRAERRVSQLRVRRVSTTLRHLAREFTDVSPLSGRPPDAAC
jgi:hypothetical protein